MGNAGTFTKELLVVGVLYSDDAREGRAREMLESLYGPVFELTEPEEFAWTDYYCTEMGSRILRRYLVFATLFDPSRLAGIKIGTNGVETSLAVEGRRLVNLDPGMLGAGRFYLATTKDRAHRIPLSEGIYTELTLIFEKGQFRALPWTYPDWASQPVRDLLARWRKRLFPTTGA